ncbi:PREDICTED: tectonin beta-propeller repeat-containing protein 1-like [Branchiostoma belcheri]|uniref:Tectonin beta-propeller repeat-containing protein 1-like n=1 Tax=Branchiostoma belcheri TaxID=7741 RepID=A0A6P4YGG4_BRABE|nr:PREDICTED: tectonin beta-propeller repeat-containing protein 1-like [Branchiostoma belcheri]
MRRKEKEEVGKPQSSLPRPVIGKEGGKPQSSPRDWGGGRSELPPPVIGEEAGNPVIGEEGDPAWRSVDGLLKFVSVGSRGVWGVNRDDDIFYRSGTLENKASSGSGWVKIEGKLKQISSGHSVWGVNANDDIFIRQDPEWRSVDGLLKFVSVGSRGVWGVNRDDDIFYRSGTLENKASSGSGWVKIEGKLKQISSGHSVWGVNANDDIFIRQGVTSTNPTGTDWLHIGEKLKQLDVSSTANQLWGVNSNDNIFRRTGISTDQPAGTGWELIEGLLKFVSVGPAGVWGVNSNDDIFYRTGTFGNEASPGSGWEHIQGKLKQISSGDNIVWGVNVNDDIFVREGISPSTPAGTGWRQIPGKLKQVEAGLSGRQAWGVNSGDSIFLRTQPTELQLPSIDGYSVRAGDCPGNDIWYIYGDGMTL